MKQGTSIHRAEDLMTMEVGTAALIDGDWVPARPLGRSGLLYRLKAAWTVFTGRADALVWPKGQ